jgi:uncharacterized membrane protein YcaP (DUF421 family)
MSIPSLWQIPLRTLVIYLVILAGLRLSGKRQLGQMNAIDLALLLLIANAVQNAMTGPDTSLLGGILAAATLLIANAALSFARARLPMLSDAVEGHATELIRNGQVLTANLRHEEITEDELMAALREHGIEDVKDVTLAELEVDGSISVVPVDAGRLRGRRRAVRFIRSH